MQRKLTLPWQPNHLVHRNLKPKVIWASFLLVCVHIDAALPEYQRRRGLPRRKGGYLGDKGVTKETRVLLSSTSRTLIKQPGRPSVQPSCFHTSRSRKFEPGIETLPRALLHRESQEMFFSAPTSVMTRLQADAANTFFPF